MTAVATAPEAAVQALLAMPVEKIDAVLCRAHPGVWAERRRGFTNAPFHWEWYEFALTCRRGALIAPREFAKTETVTVNVSAWRLIYQPGCYVFVFAATEDLAMELKERIDSAIEEVEPDLVLRARMKNKTQTVYANGSRVRVAGAGKAVRGAHPDYIIGDDVLEEEACLTSYQRDKTARWWKGTVSNMAHSGVHRKIRGTKDRTWFPPTRILIVGTPFHDSDLLMSMRVNPMYRFRRYAAEYRHEDLVDGWAVEVG